MSLKKVTAIIDSATLDDVEQRLAAINVRGFSVSEVSGCGEYRNFFRSDVKSPHSKVEIFTGENKVEEIVATILDSAHRGTQEDGIIAVLPVDSLYQIRTGKNLTDAFD